MSKIITRDALLVWLKQQAGSRTLIAPAVEGETTLFRAIAPEEIEKIHFGSNTDLSPKGCFFPQSEALLTITKNTDGFQIIPSRMEHDALLFGIRPCDARGITLIDKVFLAEPADGVYKEKRARTTLVGLACTEPCKGGFCTSMGTGPSDQANIDLLLTPTSSGYIVQEVTSKGREILDGVPVVKSEAQALRPPDLGAVPAAGIMEKMLKVFNDTYWERVADRCIHCNICSYVCPCCYCFDIRDYTGKGKVERVRSWESCQSAGFTKAAGGHDPRFTKGARLHQRWYHKLVYYPERFNELLCTGCGRCVRACPVNIDIREIISDVQKMRS